MYEPHITLVKYQNFKPYNQKQFVLQKKKKKEKEKGSLTILSNSSPPVTNSRMMYIFISPART